MKKLLSLSIILLSGCASIIDGPHQDISVNTVPPGATCTFTREGVVLGSLVSPGELHVDKTKNPIIITCTKAKYTDGSYTDQSGSDGMVLGNLISGGIIGWGVDSATGSDNKYQTPVEITLQKK